MNKILIYILFIILHIQRINLKIFTFFITDVNEYKYFYMNAFSCVSVK